MINCDLCGKNAKFLCDRCGGGYCNETCQKSDWQRHKYVCSVMPKLLPIKDDVAVNAKKCELDGQSNEPGIANNYVAVPTLPPKNSRDTIVRASTTNSKVKLSTMWREHNVPIVNNVFDCRITFIESDYIWIVDEPSIERLERLTDDMARLVSRNNTCIFENLQIGDLIAAVLVNQVFRAEVLALESSKKIVQARLIDLGKIIKLPAEDIYPALPLMSECRAFAIRVKISEHADLQITKKVTLRIVCTNRIDGAYQAQLVPKMTMPLDIPVKMLTNNPEITLVRVLQSKDNEPQVALVKINAMECLNQEMDKILSLKSDPIGNKFSKDICSFVAVRTSAGFRRGLVLDYIESPKPTFLVYLTDDGQIIINQELFYLPQEQSCHPFRVFAVTLVDGNADNKLQQKLNQSGLKMNIQFENQLKSDEKDPKYNATLLANNAEIKVHASTFLGIVRDLGCKFMSEPIENKAAVYISHVFSFYEICVSSVSTKKYRQYFKHMEKQCNLFENDIELGAGCIVLVVNPNIGNYRGEIIKKANELYVVLNVDNNSLNEEPFTALRKPCRFVENLPISAQTCKLKTISEMPANVVPKDSQALQMLHAISSEQEEFLTAFDNLNNGCIGLLSLSDKSSDLVARMLPLIFMPVTRKGTSDSDAKSPITEVHKQVPVVENSVKSIQESQPHKSRQEIEKSIKLESCFEQSPVHQESSKILETSASKVNSYPPLPLSPPASPKSKAVFERHFYKDIKKNPVPCGKNNSILLLHALKMHKCGYITACYFENETEALDFQALTNLVGHYGRCADSFVPGFVPGVGEMCLAMFKEDMEWYRAVCLSVEENSVTVSYCDFGNIEVVSLEDLKPFPSDLMHAICATKCYIKDFDETKNFKLLEDYLLKHSKVDATVEEGPEPNTRLITVTNLDKILSKEMV